MQQRKKKLPAAQKPAATALLGSPELRPAAPELPAAARELPARHEQLSSLAQREQQPDVEAAPEAQEPADFAAQEPEV